MNPPGGLFRAGDIALRRQPEQAAILAAEL
jgi:hypothetical protein